MFFSGPEGMEKFCEDLNVDPENVVMLVIAYKMGAKQMGYFTQEEWLKGKYLLLFSISKVFFQNGTFSIKDLKIIQKSEKQYQANSFLSA